MQRLIIPLLATLTIGLAACGDKKTVKSYPETTEGLEELIADIGAAHRMGAEKEAAAIATSLRPKDHDAWFQAHFDAAVAARLSAELAPRLDSYAGIAAGIAGQQARGRTVIKAEKFTDPEDDAATGVQSLALKAMTAPTALYSVRMTEPGKKSGFHLYNFVYAGGGFRLVGKMKAVDDRPPASPELQALGEIRVRDARVFLETGKLPE